MLKRSFDPVPIISSLISGFPSRYTCWKLPEPSPTTGEKRLIIRHGVWPNVRRDRIQRPSTGQVCGLAVLDYGDGVGLAQIEAFRSRSVESGDRRNAGQVSYEPREQSGHADLRIESELKSDVFYSILVVVNLHFIENVGIERKIVGTV